MITTKNQSEAQKIAARLVHERLIACANIVKDVESIFRWQGKVERAREVLLVLKSTKTKLPKIIKTVKSLHSYDVPEIIALPVAGGNPSYLRWVKESIR